jgi:hypothetical protein
VTPTVDQKCFARHTTVAVIVQAAVLVPDPCPSYRPSGNGLRFLPESARPVTRIAPTAAVDSARPHPHRATEQLVRDAASSTQSSTATSIRLNTLGMRHPAGGSWEMQVAFSSVDAVDSLEHGMALLR